MRASVAAAWPAWIVDFEGRLNFLYLDTKGKVTTGTGNLVDSVATAQTLPWLRSDGTAATPAEVSAEWRAIKALQEYKSRGGSFFGKYTSLHLTDAAIDQLLMSKTAEFWTRLLTTLPDLEAWPADAQLAILDEAWQNGPGFLDLKQPDGTYTWAGTRAAVLAQDFAGAASHVPGTGLRADARRRLFTNAAAVNQLGISPERLWNLTPPKADPVPDIKHDPKYGDYVIFRGGKIPLIDRTILLAIPSYVRKLSQGGLSRGTLSALTHVGLGAFDISIAGMTRKEVWHMCSELLRSGIVPFPRGFTWDTFQGKTLNDIHDGNEHIHCCSVESYTHLHEQAQAQIREYRNGGDGLVGTAGYTGPNTSLARWSTSPYNPKNQRPGSGLLVVQVDHLIGNSVDRNKRHTRDKGYELTSVLDVKRWNRWNAVTASGTYYAIEDGGKTYLAPKIIQS